MNTAGMMAGVLVVGSVNSSLATPHLGHYITEPATTPKIKKSIPIRISVKKDK
mgnify:CR=1 FL=1